MPTLQRPWTREVLVIVARGTTDREEIIRKATPFVPVGHAFRLREQKRRLQGAKYRRRYPDAPSFRPRDRTIAEVQRIGARTAIVKSLRSLVGSRHLVREGNHYFLTATAKVPTHRAAEES